MARLLRGVRAAWLKYGSGDYTLLGVREEDLSIENNPDISNSKDVTGAAYTTHAGFSPQTSLNYTADSDDSIYEQIEKINNELLKDDENTIFEMVVATLNDEVAKAKGATAALTGNGYKVNVRVVPTSSGGDTNGYQIPFDIYEEGARIPGTVSVSNSTGQPTFTAQS